MTRTEAVAIITAKLASLDDEQVTAVVEIVQSMPDAGQRLRPLSARETALLEQSKADFREGRVLDEEEYAERMSGFMARLRRQTQPVE